MNTDNTNIESWDNQPDARINVNARRLPLRVFIFCLLAELLLVLLDAVVNYAEYSSYGTIRRLFNITREDGLATWFMVAQTLIAGLVLWLIFFVQRGRSVGRWRITGWGFLAVFFTYMSADDGAKIHERFGTMFKQSYGSGKYADSSGLLDQLQQLFPSYEWHLAALPLLVGAGLFMLFFLWREFHTRGERLTLFAAAACMALAVGLDFIEGLEDEHAWNAYVWVHNVFDLRGSFIRHFAKSLEEFLEMLAISLLLMLFLCNLIRFSGRQLVFNFSSQEE